MSDFINPSEERIRSLLERTKTIAIVGLSPRSHRPSHHIARNLQAFGYRIIPVNPHIGAVLGERAHAKVTEIREAVDLVNVFRAREHVRDVVNDCMAADVPALWLQDGVIDVAAAREAQCAGMTVVMDRCIYRDYLRLIGAARV